MQDKYPLSQLRDIMPSLDISTGIYIYILITLILVIGSVFMLIHYYQKSRPKPCKQTEALQRLKSIDFTGTINTQLLYQFTIDAKSYLDGKNDPEFTEIEEHLLAYKYQAEAKQLSQELIQRMSDYIKDLP